MLSATAPAFSCLRSLVIKPPQSGTLSTFCIQNDLDVLIHAECIIAALSLIEQVGYYSVGFQILVLAIEYLNK